MHDPLRPEDGAAEGVSGLLSDSEQSDWGAPAGGSTASSLSDWGASSADEADPATTALVDGPRGSQPAATQARPAPPEPEAAAPERAALRDAAPGVRGPPWWGPPAPAPRPPGCLVERLVDARAGGRAGDALPASACTSEATLVAQVPHAPSPAVFFGPRIGSACQVHCKTRNKKHVCRARHCLLLSATPDVVRICCWEP